MLVAVSGGADSMALLHVLHTLAPRLQAEIAGVVHVHHGLRGEAADADAQACQQAATRLGVQFDLMYVDVKAEAVRRRWSIERTGHAVRHAAYRVVAEARGATRVAVAHTRDDQAETVILRLLRGAGTRGMSGMWPSHGLVIRPLLEVSRRDVEHYLVERGLTWREDASNVDRSIPRNVVRHEVLPALIRVAGASLPARLARQADAWRDDEVWLSTCAAVEVPSVLMPHADGGWWVDLPRLAQVPSALRRRVRLTILEQMLPHDRVTLALVQAFARLERLAEGQSGRLRGLTLTRQGKGLRVAVDPVAEADSAPASDVQSASVEGESTGEARPDAGVEAVRRRSGRRRPAVAVAGGPTIAPRTLTWPGRLELPEVNLAVEAEVVTRDAWLEHVEPWHRGAWFVALDADRVGPSLEIRGRRPGDRMRPTGVAGSQKLQDLMVNGKVARMDRDAVPVVTSSTGEIVWVVGLAVGEAFAIKPQTAAVLLLKVTRSGGIS